MAQDIPSRSTAPGEAGMDAPTRPPGELGGHTVQPWEQDAVPPTTSPNSKDVPPPELGAAETQMKGPGAGATTTAAPGNQPSGASPGHGRSVGEGGAPASLAKTAELPGSEGAEPIGKDVAPSQARPPRPPVYKPQNGHEPAPRPPPAQVAQAKAKGPPTEGDALIEAITKAIAENLAKAFHQSVAQAVREFMPLSGRSIAQPKVDVGPNLTKAAPKSKAGTVAGASAGKGTGKDDAGKTGSSAGPQGEAEKASAQGGPAVGTSAGTAPPASTPTPGTGLTAPQSPANRPDEEQAVPSKPDPSAQTGYGIPSDRPRESQYGGTIEPADEDAKAKLAAASNPKSPAIGQAAAESADRESRDGHLA